MASVYKHILIPTDGSSLSGKGVRAGVRLAKALGAKVTGVHVLAPYHVPPALVDDYERYTQKQARTALARIEREAKNARVRCATRLVKAPQPAQGILKTARAARCDLIAMASHRRSGLKALMLGSETRRVLARSKIPVVVLP